MIPRNNCIGVLKCRVPSDSDAYSKKKVNKKSRHNDAAVCMTILNASLPCFGLRHCYCRPDIAIGFRPPTKSSAARGCQFERHILTIATYSFLCSHTNFARRHINSPADIRFRVPLIIVTSFVFIDLVISSSLPDVFATRGHEIHFFGCPLSS